MHFHTNTRKQFHPEYCGLHHHSPQRSSKCYVHFWTVRMSEPVWWNEKMRAVSTIFLDPSSTGYLVLQWMLQNSQRMVLCCCLCCSSSSSWMLLWVETHRCFQRRRNRETGVSSPSFPLPILQLTFLLHGHSCTSTVGDADARSESILCCRCFYGFLRNCPGQLLSLQANPRRGEGREKERNKRR